ncbi:MAG: TIGR03960 family B12-binding radical SAM protein [Candidatus Aminicenantes bacterium]|nr:TIGR03960 family B12-binding radical SAM protein [Candidatus Aminicenantes bacterium]
MSTEDYLNDVLERVEKPGRYIGGEWNAVRKDPESVEVRIALVFPDVYEIAMSYLGQKILYDILNAHPDLLAERVFAPWPDLEKELRSRRMPLFSLENKLPLRRFDILGFSLLYELNYSNILTVLDLGGIPKFAGERGDNDPLILAGGPAAFNPEPVSDIFDAFLLGDGEDAFVEIAESVLSGRKAGAGREEILKRLAGVSGVYVPSLYECYSPSGSALLARRPKSGMPAKIRKRVKSRLGRSSFPEAIVVPDVQAVHDRVAAEVARGCPQRCRFCQATAVYFPFRVMGPALVRKGVRRSLAATGFEDVSLSALSISDYPFLEETVTALMDDLAGQKISLSLSSLRPRGLSPAVIENILRVRKTGFTLVPEAGTDRLRRVINKELDNQEILEAAAHAFRRGWRLLKLYFMVGLPTEREEDLEGIVQLVGEIWRCGKDILRQAPRINLSLSSFIPKPHTPFQWLRLEDASALLEKQRFVRSRLSRFRSVAIKAHPTQSSLLEGIFSRGDRRLGRVLARAWESGARFDSWRDGFEFSIWREALAAEIQDYHVYLGPLDPEAVLPWDHIDTGIRKEFLLAEMEKAGREERTASCWSSDCRQCQGCDPRLRLWKKLLPAPEAVPIPRVPAFGRRTEKSERYEVVYEKTGLARFLSHRDLINHLQRSLRRAGVSVAHSEGFHPKMLISYGPALPLGMEAKGERFEFKSRYRFQERALLRRLNRSVRTGIRFLRVRAVGENEPPLGERIKVMVYSLDLRDDHVQSQLEACIRSGGAQAENELDFVRREMDAFLARNPDYPVAFRLDEEKKRLVLEFPKSSRRGLRPQDVMGEVFGIKNASYRLTREGFVVSETGNVPPDAAPN